VADHFIQPQQLGNLFSLSSCAIIQLQQLSIFQPQGPPMLLSRSSCEIIRPQQPPSFPLASGATHLFLPQQRHIYWASAAAHPTYIYPAPAAVSYLSSHGSCTFTQPQQLSLY
jgi:hypothetical protein